MKVVIAFDDSECSVIALQSLMGMNWAAGDEIKVLSVVDPFCENADEERDTDAAEILVAETIDKINAQHAGLEVSGEVLLGTAAERVLDTCREWNADLLVLGANRGAASSKLMLGKNAGALMANAPCSVMVAKDNDLSSGADYKNVLIPVSSRDCSEQTIQGVLDSKWPADVSFHVVTVIEKIDMAEILDTTDLEIVERQAAEHAKLREESESYVAAIAERLNDKFGESRASSEVLEGNVRDEVLRLSNELPAGLIVLGTQGKNFFEKILLGSMSQAIASQSPCSVEVVKSGNSEEEAA
jgi:nucleotide-binding universal stress UspA family protein